MEPRGTKPKSTSIKLLEGVTRKDRLNLNEPKPRPLMPECPKWLDKVGKAEWDRKSKELYDMGVLTIVDDTFLGLYCHMYSIIVECKKIIDEAGGIEKYTKDRNSQTQPVVSMMWKAIDNLKSFGASLGMSPSSRERIEIKPNADEDSVMEELIK